MYTQYTHHIGYIMPIYAHIHYIMNIHNDRLQRMKHKIQTDSAGNKQFQIVFPRRLQHVMQSLYVDPHGQGKVPFTHGGQ